MKVELYAEFDPKMLLPFLRSSQHYKLEKVSITSDFIRLFASSNLDSYQVLSQAYEVCSQRNLLREQVFILGRMGNSKQALAVIINKLEDIEEVF